MKIAAIGDSHLGRNVYSTTDNDGVNLREIDFENNLLRAIKAVLAREPDIVCFLGDVFDIPRPTYRSYSVFRQVLKQLKQSGVNVVCISGNHDTPRLSSTTSPYEPLTDEFSEFKFACFAQYQMFDFGDVTIHAVGQMLNPKDAHEALVEASQEIKKRPRKINVLLTHPRLTELQPKHSDLNEIEVSEAELSGDFALLGHYHNFARVKENIVYAGAPDTFDFSDEPERKKGFIVLDTNSGSIEHNWVKNSREMRIVNPLNGIERSPSAITEALIDALNTLPEGCIAKLIIEDVDLELWRLIDIGEIRREASHIMHLAFDGPHKSNFEPVELASQSNLELKWREFLKSKNLKSEEIENIELLGWSYISSAIERAV